MTAPVWQAKFDGIEPIPVLSLFSDTSNRLSNPTYRSLTRLSQPAPYNWAGGTDGGPLKMFYSDFVHLRHILYQAFIMPTQKSPLGIPLDLVIPSPIRTDPWGNTIEGLDITNAELEIEIQGFNLHLAQKVRIFGHAQWFDPDGAFGEGTAYNAVFVPKGRPTIDEALGFTPVAQRSAAGEFKTFTPWINYTIKFDPNELVDLSASQEKLYGLKYAPIGDTIEQKQRVFYRQLLNTVTLFHALDAGLPPYTVLPYPNSIVPPSPQPPEYGTSQQAASLYMRKAVLRVDLARNPNAVELIL